MFINFLNFKKNPFHCKSVVSLVFFHLCATRLNAPLPLPPCAVSHIYTYAQTKQLENTSRDNVGTLKPGRPGFTHRSISSGKLLRVKTEVKTEVFSRECGLLVIYWGNKRNEKVWPALKGPPGKRTLYLASSKLRNSITFKVDQKPNKTQTLAFF